MANIPDVTPPDYTTVVGQIRLLIPDMEQLPDLANPTAAHSYIFDDTQLQALGVLYADNVKRAAATVSNSLAYDVSIPGNSVYAMSEGMTLAATDVLTVRSSTAAALTFTVFGSQVA